MTTTAGSPMSRRERKKLRTRDTIVVEARRLFAERGYDGTTVSEIAEAADVAASTVFAYFATKDQIFFSDFDEMIADCARSVDLWSDEGPTIDAIRRWFDERWPAFYDREPEWPARRAQILLETPTLEGLRRGRMTAIEATFFRAFARDFGEGPDGVRALVAANATLGAIAALAHYWQANEHGAAPAAVIEHALAFAAAGADALRARDD
jgi:AcrR family transcriptional regulator